METADEKGNEVRSSLFAPLLEHGTALITATGLIIYGIVRVGLDAFYNKLGVRPEEAGLGYGYIVTRAVLGLLVVLAISTAAAGLIIVVVSGLFRRRGAFDSEGTDPQITPQSMVFLYVALVTGILAIGLMLVAIRTSMAIDPNKGVGEVMSDAAAPLILPVTIAIPLFLIAWLMFSSHIGSRRPSAGEQAYRKFMNYGVTILALGIVALGLFMASQQSGGRAAERIMRGQEPARGRIIGLPWLGVLSVEARCVTLKYAGDPKSAPTGLLPTRAFYLGQANNTLVFYVVGSGALRLPAGDFAMQDISSSRCVP